MSTRIFACLSLMLASLPAVAAEPENPTAEQSVQTAPTRALDAEQTERAIRRAIRQLDSDTFAERREAAEILRDFGAAAIAPLEEACRDGAGERVAQSIEILKSFAASEDHVVRDDAMRALKRIADGENATAAKLAATVVQSMQTLPGRRQFPEFGPIPNAGLDGMAMRGRGRNFSMSTVRNNGREEIKITDDELHVQIERDPNGPIRVEWKEGDGESQVAKADDLDQLRNEHPEAAELVDKYQARAAGGPLMGNRFFAPMQVDGLPIPQPMFQMDEHFARMRAEHQRMVDEMRAQHEQRMQEMRRLAPPVAPAIPPSQLGRLRDHAERLQRRVQNGEVDEATRAEVERLQRLLEELQTQMNQ
ncbi:hypothetical protein LOC68_25750 [Blastopirellula sp. JC732]|uniref:HEAT repeat domain-containing protein n=1 Tax=Blastopirellula sediminis TaxID=2894196 RepID=A0A9X1SML5_9BACT|nr:hypothetical protein [Blastopirellula sediminis]MCC9604887.1 hypothetical protein [Blastopirellula sediminis]MCC9631814.1 hypothetical protein [Blastopirellula sediminis]